MQPAAPPAVARVVGWTGAVLFLASLIYWFLTYETTWGTPAGSGAGFVRPIVFNVLLFSAFALHHSVFAREPVRRWVRHLVSGSLERSAYVWVASVMLIAVCAAWQPVAGIAWQVAHPWSWLLRAVQLGGLWLTITSAAVIDVLELAGVRQLEVSTAPVEFKTSGPYGWMRHPIYSGWFLVVFGEPAMTATRLVFAIVSGVYLLIAIPLEERSLRASTGGAYDRYLAGVRWKLIPGIY